MSSTVQSAVTAQSLASISTPDLVETRLGALEFVDGAPTAETATLVYDHLDFLHGVQAFTESLPAASTHAIRQGFLGIGVQDNDILIYSELMDAQSLFLTANADTVYFLTFLDLTAGPLVLEIPPLGPPTGILGTIDDMWFGWVTDFGVPGPDRGAGGRYLIVGPDYSGPLPDSGFHLSRCATTRALVLGRAFMVDNDPTIAVNAIKDGVKIYPLVAGAVGTSVATFLAGAAPLAPVSPAGPTRFVDAGHVAVNTIPPNDESYWDLINEVVQREPVGAGGPEVLGLLASVGITKGKPFAPDDRMRGILAEAVVVGNATARTLAFDPREQQDWAFYPGSAWFNMLFEGGYQFLDPPPDITPTGVVPRAGDGARKINSRLAFFYPYTGITPAMCMRLTGIGSQYLIAMKDADGDFLDGAQSYRLTLPAGIPQARFWSVTVYDRQTRSMLQTDQAFPRVSSQVDGVQTSSDGSTEILFGPVTPTGNEGNWLQTVPGKGWFAILRLYSPLASFFDKTWRPGEIGKY